MHTYTPDRWIILKFKQNDQDVYKVFGTWGGSYTYGPSWKVNSGITKVTKEDNYYLFEGYSGSVYKCHMGAYGTTAYGAGVIHGIEAEILDSDTDFLSIKYTNENSYE